MESISDKTSVCPFDCLSICLFVSLYKFKLVYSSLTVCWQSFLSATTYFCLFVCISVCFSCVFPIVSVSRGYRVSIAWVSRRYCVGTVDLWPFHQVWLRRSRQRHKVHAYTGPSKRFSCYQGSPLTCSSQQFHERLQTTNSFWVCHIANNFFDHDLVIVYDLGTRDHSLETDDKHINYKNREKQNYPN